MSQSIRKDDPPGDLGAHGRFVRRLAGEMLGLGREADDLAQDAVLAAIRTDAVARVPRPAMQAWLARTVQRLAGAHRRQASARTARESDHALQRDEVPTPLGLAVKKETVQTVYDAVLSLPEPYLTTVLLTYYEDLSAEQIAERLALPIATVRSQQQRAKDKLRERLQRELGGSERTLGLALLPLVRSQLEAAPVPVSVAAAAAATPPLTAPLFLGVIAMSWKWISIVGAVGLLTFLAMREPTGSVVPTDGTLSQPLDPEADLAVAPSPGPATDVEPDSTSRRIAGLPEGTAPSTAPDTTAALEPGAAPNHPAGLFGRVLYQGAPLAGVLVTQSRPEIAYLKDAAGTRLPGSLNLDPAVEETMVAAQFGYSTFRPIPLDAVQDGAPSGQFLLPTDHHEAPTATTDADGWFHFPAMPEGAYLLTLQHLEQDLALRDEPRRPGGEARANLGDFELQPAATLRGTLLCGRGARLDGHEVFLRGLRSSSTSTDASGRFVLSDLPAGDYLLRVRPGEGLYLTDNPDVFLRLATGQDRKAEIELPAIACSVASIQVTRNGSPWAQGGVAFLHQGSRFGVHVGLDDEGRGRATLPAHDPVHCEALVGTNRISLGPDLVLKEGPTEVALELEVGALRLSVPTEHFPAPETCQLTFSIDSPDYTAVRFDLFNGAEGVPAQLDSSGQAVITVPAWTRLEPVLRYKERVWVYVDTDKASFPAGSSRLRFTSDPESGALSITGGLEPGASSEQPRPKQYRLELTWTSEITGEAQSLVCNLDPLRFASGEAELQVFDFDFVPAGRRSFQVTAQRRYGSKGSDLIRWPLELDIRAGEVTEARTP